MQWWIQIFLLRGMDGWIGKVLVLQLSNDACSASARVIYAYNEHCGGVRSSSLSLFDCIVLLASYVAGRDGRAIASHCPSQAQTGSQRFMFVHEMSSSLASQCKVKEMELFWNSFVELIKFTWLNWLVRSRDRLTEKWVLLICHWFLCHQF